MPLKPNVLTTEADLLIDLLRNVKEISMADAAKELNMPVKTVESWANFLEEEKKLSIKYKFTTPFLVYVDEDAEVKKFIKAPVPSFFLPKKEKAEDAMEELSELVEKISTTDVSKEPEVLLNAISKLASLKKLIIGEADKKLFDINLSALEAYTDRLKSLIKQKKPFNKNEIGEINEKINELYSVLKKQPVKTVPKQVTKPGKSREKTEISALIEKAYALITEGRTEEAEAIYREIKQSYGALPDEFAEKKASLERDLISIHGKLAETIEKKSMISLKEATDRINKLMNEANAAIKKGDFKRMEAAYSSMKATFERLPAGFIKEKKDIEEEIIKFYEDALRKKESFYLKELSFKTKKISALLKKLREAIKKDDMNEAINTYNEVRNLHTSLPPGFIEEKVALQEQIIPIYEELSTTYRDEVYEITMRKISEIKKLLLAMQQHLTSNSIGLAETTYKQMQQIYDGIPRGFLEEKTEIQEEMLRAYEALISKSEILDSQQIYAKISELKNLLGGAKSYLKSNDPDMAEQVYFQLTKLYNEMPTGFIAEKTKIRKEILELYKNITLKKDQAFLQKKPSEANEKYQEIIHALIEIRHAIEQRRFNSLAPMYNHIKMLFNELPLGVVHKNMKLRQEIMKVYQELQLYKKVLQLEEAANKKDSKKMKQLLGEITRLKNGLAAECPEDKELFDFVNQKYDFYIRASEKKSLLFKRKPKIKEIRPLKKIPFPPVQPFQKPVQAVEQALKPSFEKETFTKDTLARLKEREDDLREIKRKIDILKQSMKPGVRAI